MHRDNGRKRIGDIGETYLNHATVTPFPKRVFPTQQSKRWRIRLKHVNFIIADIIEAFRVKRSGRIAKHILGAATVDGRKAAIYVHFSSTGRVSAMVEKQLAIYRSHGFDIFFVSSQIDDISIKRLQPLCRGIFLRRNFGLDFGAWHDILMLNKHDLGSISELLLVNDSIVGPIQPLEPLFDVMRQKEGLWGLIDSRQQNAHLQSFFLLARGASAIAAVVSFFKQYKPSSNKERTIHFGELRVTQWVARMGVPVYSLFGLDDVLSAHLDNEESRAEFMLSVTPLLHKSHGSLVGTRVDKITALHAALNYPPNPTHHLANTLVMSFGFPFIKTELVRKNPTKMTFGTCWPATITASSPCSLEMIVDHLCCL